MYLGYFILTYKTSHLKHELITGLLEKNSKVINIAIYNVYAIDSLKHGLMQEKSTNRATEILVLFYETWINTFCKSNSGGAGVDGVEDSFIAYLRLWDQADLGAKVGNALALRSHADPLWKIPRLTALLVEPAPNMVASQSHTGSCSLPTGAVHSGLQPGLWLRGKSQSTNPSGKQNQTEADLRHDSWFQSDLCIIFWIS